jgi:hypothetical protein
MLLLLALPVSEVVSHALIVDELCIPPVQQRFTYKTSTEWTTYTKALGICMRKPFIVIACFFFNSELA